MVAGLSTGSIIAMAMDFTMWPRVQPQTSQQVEKESSKVEIDADKRNEKHATAQVHQRSEAIEETENEVIAEKNDIKEPEKTEQKKIASRSSSPKTQIIHGVPDDDLDVGNEENGENPSSSITNPVPDDSDAPLKTLLEKAQEVKDEIQSE